MSNIFTKDGAVKFFAAGISVATLFHCAASFILHMVPGTDAAAGFVPFVSFGIGFGAGSLALAKLDAINLFPKEEVERVVASLKHEGPPLTDEQLLKIQAVLVTAYQKDLEEKKGNKKLLFIPPVDGVTKQKKSLEF